MDLLITAVALNLNGLKETHVDEIRNLVKRSGATVIRLSETVFVYNGLTKTIMIKKSKFWNKYYHEFHAMNTHVINSRDKLIYAMLQISRNPAGGSWNKISRNWGCFYYSDDHLGEEIST